MPRKLRIHYDQAIYHVMMRGNYKQTVFYDDADYAYFIKLLQRAIKKFNCKLHLYCLMTNHIHLVLEVSNIPMGKIIQAVTSPFTRICNKKYERNGHAFSGRPLAKLVCDDLYLLELCYYVHRNPLKAGMVNDLNDYPWSSHHAYLQGSDDSWMTTAYVQELLKHYIGENKSYADFMSYHEQINVEPKFCNFDVNGELIIRDSVNHKIKSSKRLDLSQFSIAEIISDICNLLGISEKVLRSEDRCHEIVRARCLVVYYACYHGHYKLKDIALVFYRNPDVLSRTMHKIICCEKNKVQIAYLKNQVESMFWKKIISPAK
ncbi:MAG: hypothetical protein COB66_07130 [Coxiella sp. (in: Bacteria)]|nr:MAG: hypothetical protein COB66_07130 [Coxiella sp. (in: g-proteobacteria)]